MKQIHNGKTNAGRMPLFFPSQEMELQWINQELSDSEIEEIVSYEVPSEQLGYRPVYTIRSPMLRPDGKAKYESWEWEGLPVLRSEGEVKDR